MGLLNQKKTDMFFGFSGKDMVPRFRIAKFVYKFYNSSVGFMVQCEAPKISKLVYNSNTYYGLWYL